MPEVKWDQIGFVDFTDIKIMFFLEIGRESISANSHIYNYDHKIKLHMNFFLYIQHFLWISISSFIFITIITTSGILSIKSGHFHGFSWIFIDLTFYSRTTTWKIITNVKAKLFTFLMADLLVIYYSADTIMENFLERITLLTH